VELIPAIDLRGGRCVRLYQGDFQQQTAYDVEPGVLLGRYAALGARWVHVVDLDGARDGVRHNAPLVAELAQRSALHMQVGGGVRCGDDVEALIAAGAARVVVGSAAIERPAEVATWLNDFGPQRVCVAFDLRAVRDQSLSVQTRGWKHDSSLSLWDALKAFPPQLLLHVLCTDIARDGTLQGPNVALYREVVSRHPEIAWQASGGIRNAADLKALAAAGVAGAVSGKALLESRIPEQELLPFLPAASSPASTCATARS
jgi:phosphoribosylformimino-5-aminoimidazole carboxamide ribotide isomerase